jgi:VCBS repeat-containing protein
VRQPNQAPTAFGVSASGNEDSPITIMFSATDPEGDALTYQIETAPANGTLIGSGNTRTYQPNANFNGTDTFTYRAFDGQLVSGSATVTINIAAVNDAPVATNMTVTLNEDTNVVITLNGFDIDTPIVRPQSSQELSAIDSIIAVGRRAVCLARRWWCGG